VIIRRSSREPADKPEQSPSLLAKPPTRGEGVRRLNARPAILAGCALALVVGAVGYTYHDRIARAAAGLQHAATHKPEPGNASSVLSGAPAGGEIVPAAARTGLPDHPAATPPQHPQSGQQQAATQPSDNSGAGGQGQGEDDATKARREAWKVYYDQVAQLQKDRFGAASAALNADAGTASDAGGQQAAPAAPAGVPMTPGGMGGVPGATPSGAFPGALAGGYGGPGGYGLPVYPPAQVNGSAQREKQAFLLQPGDLTGASDDLPAVIHDPASPYMVMQGTAIPAEMDGGVNSDIPGQVRAHVADPVYDTATGNFLLIPAGSTLIGEYDNMVSQGQSRVAVIWHRIIFPDTSSISLGSMAGADQGGYAGFHDQVNTHLWSKLGNALLISIAAAGVQLAQGTGQNTYGYNSQQIAAGALGQQFGELGQEYARAGLSIPNTLEIRPGYRFVVMVNRNMHLRPYVDQRNAGAATSVSFGPMVH